MSRHCVSDSEWEFIRLFVPKERTGKPGRPWSPHRQVINGILMVLRTGIPWADLPSEFGKAKTVYNRFRRWVKSGLWQKIFEVLIDRLLKHDKINFELWCVDGTIVRAHRVASGALKGTLSTEENMEKHALGRSRGGYSTKLHFLTDGQGIPLSITITAGQRHEAPEFDNVLDACLINTFRKAKRPHALAGDKAYSSQEIRNAIAKLEIEDVIPTRSNQQANQDFDKTKYRKRNIIERVIGWLKENRRVATRYDKNVDHYLAMIHIAIIRLILKSN